MNIFFDTEFTGLSSEPRLISVGMVAANGLELYVELSDGWSASQCSTWVQKNVLSQLGSVPPLCRRDAATEILRWLSSFETTPVLLADSDWDTELLGSLLNASSNTKLGDNIERVEFESKLQWSLFERVRQEYFLSNGLQPHHALTDARVLCHAYGAVRKHAE